MIDHLAIKVADFAASKAFYTSVLETLGCVLIMEHEISGAGFGKDMKPTFWVQPGSASGPIHIAFAADNRAVVDAFYQAAIAAGASCNGAPGERQEYHPTYYGAFVIDPDGNNVEAVCHFPT